MNEVFTHTYTWNNGNVYQLHYTQQADGCFRIEILAQPDYSGRDTSLRITGRQEEGGCFFIGTEAGRLSHPSTFRQVEIAAADWMFYTQMYIETGESPYGSDDDLPPGCILWL